MKFQLKYLSAVIAMAFASVHANAPQRMGNFDFSYEISGDQRVKPVQVFDDGVSTYFQFRAGEPIPAIFANGQAGLSMQTPEMQGPYTKVGGVNRAYTLRLGYGVGSVTYAGVVQAPNAGFSAQPNNTTASFAQVVVPGALTAADPRVMARQRASMDRLVAAAGGLESMPRSVFEEHQPRIAVDVNSYATPIKGDIAQFQPTGVSPIVSAGPLGATVNPSSGSRQVSAGAAVGTSQGLTRQGMASVRESNIQFVIGTTKLGPKGLEALKTITSGYTPNAQYEIIGRYDSNYKEGVAEARARAIAERLVAAGIPKQFIKASTTESLIPVPQNGVTTGATVIVRDAAGAVPTQAFVDTAQLQEAGLNAIVAQLRSGKLSPAKAATQVEQIRQSTVGHYAQPIAGFQEAQISKWQMRAADVSVQGVLQRWARDAGWQLIWKNGPDIRVTADAELIRDGFVSAADYLVSQARGYGHRIRANAYNNKVLVVTAE